MSFSFDDGDFDDAEEDEGLDDLENAEDVRRYQNHSLQLLMRKRTGAVSHSLTHSLCHCCSGGTRKRPDLAGGRRSTGQSEEDHNTVHDQV